MALYEDADEASDDDAEASSTLDKAALSVGRDGAALR